MDERAKRVGLNEAAFRRANERIAKVAEGFSMTPEPSNFICECGSGACDEAISLTLAEYQHVRSEPTWFAMVPGHEREEVERVVEDHGAYLIAAKLPGGPAGMAIREDESTY